MDVWEDGVRSKKEFFRGKGREKWADGFWVDLAVGGRGLSGVASGF